MLSTAIIAFSLSSDAFAASIAKGARFPGMSMWRSTGIALGFGVLEALAEGVRKRRLKAVAKD